MRTLAIVVIVVLLYSCDNLNEKVQLINTSDIHLYYQVLTDTILYPGLYLDDFPPGDTSKAGIIGGENVWEYRINNESIDSSLHIYIFSSNEIDSEIINNRDYRKISLTVEELNYMDWIVKYPDDFN